MQLFSHKIRIDYLYYVGEKLQFKRVVTLFHFFRYKYRIKDNTSEVLHLTLEELFFRFETTKNGKWQHLHTLHYISGHKIHTSANLKLF